MSMNGADRMHLFEQLDAKLRKQGWHPKLTGISGGRWQCDLDCFIDKPLPGNVPRPMATADTALQAMELAADAAERKLVEYGKKNR